VNGFFCPSFTCDEAAHSVARIKIAIALRASWKTRHYKPESVPILIGYCAGAPSRSVDLPLNSSMVTTVCHPFFGSSPGAPNLRGDSSAKIAFHHERFAIRRTVIVVHKCTRLILLQHGAVNVRADNKKPTNVVARKDVK
jgi:hypothetical protein